LIVLRGEIDVLLEHLQFVPRIFVQANLADTQDIRPVEKVRDDTEDLVSQNGVFTLLGVDAEPAKVREGKLCRTLRLEVGELAEVVVKALHTTSIEPSPKRWLADGSTPCRDHGVIV